MGTFRETTLYANTVLFDLIVTLCISAHFCVMAPPSPLLHLPDPNSEDPNSEDSPTTDQTHNAQLVRSHFYMSLKLLLSTYWVLVVVGAFLLVILTGQPSLLKTVYLVFFFVFLIIYQVRSMIEPPEVTQEMTQPMLHANVSYVASKWQWHA